MCSGNSVQGCWRPDGQDLALPVFHHRVVDDRHLALQAGAKAAVAGQIDVVGALRGRRDDETFLDDILIGGS